MSVRPLTLALVAALWAGTAAEAQLPGRPRARPQPSQADTLRNRGDSLGRADTLARGDTIAKATFMTPPDTIMQRLMNTPGYNTTRYQGELIAFDALTRALQLTNRVIVQRDSQLVKSDTAFYNGTGNSIRVGTSPNRRGNVFVGPGQAPLLTSGAGTYDLATRRASVTGVKTKVPQSGQELTITGEKVTVVASSDTLRNPNGATYYLRDGTVTACDDSIPDYFFKAGEIKRTGSFVVARPAVLYIGDVPVLWLPFLFQDIRNGRHSGMVTPTLGVSDFIRNSKSYRRNVEGLGYYFAISDYMDAQASLDWRSNAGESDFNDPGYVRYNGEFRYRWLDRFVAGNVALSHTTQGGSINDALSWGHQQSFSRNSSFSMNLNLVKNTTLQRQTTINPYSALATISSQANYQQKIGPAQLSLGGSQKQYPGRTQLDRQFPTLSLTTSPLNVASWLTWTPSFNYSSTQSLGIDQPTQLGLLLRTGKNAAGRDTVFGDTLRRAAYTSSASFDTPIQIFGYNLGNSFTINSARNDFPEREIVTDVNSGVESDRIYAQTYHTEVNWTPQFTLPPLARNNFNFTPSLSLSNVDGSAFWIRNERTGGRWVHQSKRPSLGLSASPTIFGLFSGFGPFQRFRHSIAPTVGYSYAPASDVSDEFLAAIGRTRFSRTGGTGYLGALAQNALTFGLSTNIEGKLRSHNDSNPESGDKLKLLAINFTSINYDFERARATHSRLRGLTTQNFGYTVLVNASRARSASVIPPTRSPSSVVCSVVPFHRPRRAGTGSISPPTIDTHDRSRRSRSLGGPLARRPSSRLPHRGGRRPSPSARRASVRRSVAPTSSSSIRRCNAPRSIRSCCVCSTTSASRMPAPTRRRPRPSRRASSARRSISLRPRPRSAAVSTSISRITGPHRGRPSTISRATTSRARSCRSNATCTTGAPSSPSRSHRTAASRSTS